MSVPTGDVLKEQYEETTFQNIKCIDKDENIFFTQNDIAFNIVTPIITLKGANVNQEEDHAVLVDSNTAFFKKLEQLTVQAMRYAFDSPTLYQEATEIAWERVNMESDDVNEQAFENFLHGAKMPNWILRKKSKHYRTYVPIVDVNALEHTGCFTVLKGARVKLSIRLWPYHMNGTTYGVSASIGDGGIMVYNYGGPTVPRKQWRDIHYYVKDGKVKDARGHDFVVTLTPIDRDDNVVYFTGLQPVQILEDKVKAHMNIKNFTSNMQPLTHDRFTIQLEPRDVYHLTPVLYNTKQFGGLMWSIYTEDE